MSNRAEVWTGFGTVLLIMTAAVVLLLFAAIPLHNFYAATYGEVVIHSLWGAAAVVILHLHSRLALGYLAILIAYQNKQAGSQNMEFASYSAGVAIAAAVNLFWQFYVRPSIKPNEKGPIRLVDRFQ